MTTPDTTQSFNMEQINTNALGTSCSSKENKPTVCLVDGSGYIFRAFYALPPMTRPDGTPVGAVYGFINMLMALVRESGCDHIVVIFDAARRNFRNDIYPAYKANRSETPPELVPQFPLIRQATEAFNVPWIEMEGYEADDLIATYARIAEGKGWDARIISGDKDLMQLMRKGVSLYDPMKRKQLTEEDVKNKFGVTPDKVVDVQALMGDSTDNVPGASGIGPKTAAELINQFGSLDNLLQNLSNVPQPKRREGLIRDTEQILISKKLVMLDDHAPVNKDLSTFKVPLPDYDKILTFLEDNNFKSLIERTKNWAKKQEQGTNWDGRYFKPTSTAQTSNSSPLPNIPQKVVYELVQTTEDLEKWIARIKDKKTVAIDTETNSLNPFNAKLVGFSLSCEPGHACYVPLRHGGDEKGDENATDLFAFNAVHRPKQISVKQALDLLRPILVDPSILKIGHNIKYDMHIFASEYGKDLIISPVQDTMLMSYTLYGTTHGHSMDELAERYLHHNTIKYTDVCGKGRGQISFDAVELDVAREYAAEDADITLRLFNFFKMQMTDPVTLKVYNDIDSPLIPILFEMEQKGIMVDKEQLNDLNNYFITELDRLTAEIYALADEEFNINSPAQLGVILFEKLKLDGGKRGTKGAWTTDVKVLEKLADEGSELAVKVLEYRSYAKLKSTYVDALLTLLEPSHKRIHTSFSLTVTNTGRLASSDPNLQNIPIRTQAGKEIRKAFIARPGYKLLAADYSQIELRLMANVADVKLLKEALLSKSDIHASTASQVFGIPLEQIDADTRRKAKAINFGIMYGISAFGLANQLKISRTEAKSYIDAYFSKYPEMRTFMEQTVIFAHEHGYVVTPYGRKCFINGINDKSMRGFAERAAINAPIQGGAADIIKMAMQKVQKEIKASNLDMNLLLQVHDELVFEVADKDIEAAKVLVKQAMESVTHLDVPMTVDVGVGQNWKDAH